MQDDDILDDWEGTVDRHQTMSLMEGFPSFDHCVPDERCVVELMLVGGYEDRRRRVDVDIDVDFTALGTFAKDSHNMDAGDVMSIDIIPLQ